MDLKATRPFCFKLMPNTVESHNEQKNGLLNSGAKPSKRGGWRPNSGRKPGPKKPEVLSLLAQAYELLDRSTMPAIQCVVELLEESTHPMVRLKAAKIILSKTMPDLSHHTGDRQPAIINIVYGHLAPISSVPQQTTNRIQEMAHAIVTGSEQPK